jgi:glycerophosphoryl diester phosphodiesterase
VQLALDSRSPSGRPVQLHIETKHPTRYGGLVERALVALLTRYGLATPLSRSTSPVTVMSYALTSLRRVHALAPVLPTVLLMDRVPVRYRDGRLPAAGGRRRCRPARRAQAPRLRPAGPRARGCAGGLHVDEPGDVDLCLDLGVDVIISNLPQRVRERLAARSGRR